MVQETREKCSWARWKEGLCDGSVWLSFMVWTAVWHPALTCIAASVTRDPEEPLTLVSIDVKRPMSLLKKHPRLSNTILCWISFQGLISLLCAMIYVNACWQSLTNGNYIPGSSVFISLQCGVSSLWDDDTPYKLRGESRVSFQQFKGSHVRFYAFHLFF